MPEATNYAPLADLTGLDADHPLVKLADAEHARLMRRLGGRASEREAWLVVLCVQRAVEIEATLTRIQAALRGDA